MRYRESQQDTEERVCETLGNLKEWDAEMVANAIEGMGEFLFDSLIDAPDLGIVGDSEFWHSHLVQAKAEFGNLKNLLDKEQL